MPLVNDVCSEDFGEDPVNLKQLKTRSVALNMTSAHQNDSAYANHLFRCLFVSESLKLPLSYVGT